MVAGHRKGGRATALPRTENARLKHELARAEAKIAALEALADVDPLTGVLNRRGFERELKRSLAYVARYGVSAALLYVDLDGFKTVNDRHGHSVGDRMLRQVARALVGRVRASDIVGRLGGDELAVLLWNISEDDAVLKARALEALLAKTVIGKSTPRIAIGASIGVVALRGSQTPRHAIGAADKAMYARKREKKRRRRRVTARLTGR